MHDAVIKNWNPDNLVKAAAICSRFDGTIGKGEAVKGNMESRERDAEIVAERSKGKRG